MTTTSYYRRNIPPPPAPVWLPALRAGELDGRYIDASADIGVYGDFFPSIDVISVVINRQDKRPMTVSDLQLAGGIWPLSLDDTGLILTIGFNAPAGAAGITYELVLTANRTAQGRLFIRDLLIEVSSRLG